MVVEKQIDLGLDDREIILFQRGSEQNELILCMISDQLITIINLLSTKRSNPKVVEKLLDLKLNNVKL